MLRALPKLVAMMENHIDVVIMGSSPTGLYAVRELALAGFSVALVDISHGCAFHSKYIKSKAHRFQGDLPSIEHWLQELSAKQEQKIILLPSSDIFIEFILQRAQQLSAKFKFTQSYFGNAAQLLDKKIFHQLCQQHNMATPGVWQAENQEGLRMLAETIPYPCILKPELIHRAVGFLKGKKVLLAETKAEYLQHVDAIPEGLGGWLVQEIIPGAESEITLFGGYVDQQDEVRQSFTGRKLRQYPAGFGSASLVTSEICQETKTLTLQFIRRIGYQGVFGAEYKRDPRDGRLKIIEINPRPTLWFQTTHDAGKRIVEAMLNDLMHQKIIREMPQSEKVCWRYGLKDMASALFYRKHKSTFIFPAPDTSTSANTNIKSWPVFAKYDFMPVFYEPIGYLRKAWLRF